MKLIAGILEGSKLALARAITLVENEDPVGLAVLRGLYGHVGSAFRVGITGPPGCGKSTLVRGLAQVLTGRDQTVGIVAVDPSSPFTGGALLGDRVRMNAVVLDPKVYIRSMASRGAFGGLSVTAQNAADLIDAWGRDFILYETVGVGQSEVEIADAADTSVVVLSPESGDGIQAMKAGLMEIADIIVVNKADREGVDRMVVELQMIMSMRRGGDADWTLPIVKTVASKDHGLEDLIDKIVAHQDYLTEKGGLEIRRRGMIRKRIFAAAEHAFRILVLSKVTDCDWDEHVADVLAGQETPNSIAARIVGQALSGAPVCGQGGQGR